MATITNHVSAAAAVTKPDNFVKSGMNFHSLNPLAGFEATIASYDNGKSLVQLIKYNDQQTRFQFPALENGKKTNDGIFYEIAVLTVSRSDTGQIAVYKCVVDKPKNRALEGKSYFIRDIIGEEAHDSNRNPIVLAIRTILPAKITVNSTKRKTNSQSKASSKKANKERTIEGVKLELADKKNRTVIDGLYAVVESGKIEKQQLDGSNLNLTIASKSNSANTRNTKFEISISDRVGVPHKVKSDGRLLDGRLCAKLHAKVIEGRDKDREEDYIMSSSNVKQQTWKEAKFPIPKLLKRFLFQRDLELPS